MIDPWIKGATRLPDAFKDLSKLGRVDLIMVTHGHGDHLGDAMDLAKTNDVPNALLGPLAASTTHGKRARLGLERPRVAPSRLARGRRRVGQRIAAWPSRERANYPP
jgi:glyoxylase-like metal-dependent hydrolase (beta-lactamase superfamily II)